MQYASIENITKSFGIRTLFSDITFYIEEGDKIALVARNGIGKSTLLKIIAGKEPPDSGTVRVNNGIEVVMLQQTTQYNDSRTIWEHILQMDHPVATAVGEYERLNAAAHPDQKRLTELITKLTELNAWTFESELKQILGKLQLHDLDIPVNQLSGGQKKRVALAQALLQAQLHDGRCLMVLDEPTNHLDVEMIEWLEEYLSTQKSTMLLVTHDRYFLDSVCSQIIELDEEKIFIYKGNYDYFLEQKSLRKEVQNSELKKNKNLFRKELDWMRKQPRARTTKSKSRQDSFYDLKEKVAKQKIDADLSLQMKMTRLGGKILEMKKVYKSFGDKQILKGFDYTFKKGEKIGIVGKNGAGKTTFIRVALGLEAADSGKINHGETVVFGYYSQKGLAFKEDKRAIAYVKEIAEFFPLADGTKISASQFMEKFGFTPHQQFTPLSKLSGGEKKRLNLLRVLFKNPNFLILDEPTNDLDLQTLRTLEEFLSDFAGCLLVVSHDRYFMDRLIDHLFVFEGDGEIRDYPGNYTQYREAMALEASLKEEQKKENEEKDEKNTRVKTNDNKLSYNEKREMDMIAKELPKLEKRKKALEEKMSEKNLDYETLEELTTEMGTLLNEIDEKEMRWLELSEIENPS